MEFGWEYLNLINLKLMELSEKSLNEEKELITYSVLKGMMEFGRTMEKSFDFAES